MIIQLLIFRVYKMVECTLIWRIIMCIHNNIAKLFGETLWHLLVMWQQSTLMVSICMWQVWNFVQGVKRELEDADKHFFKWKCEMLTDKKLNTFIQKKPASQMWGTFMAWPSNFKGQVIIQGGECRKIVLWLKHC